MSGSTGAEKNSDGTVTVRYKLPYASMFVKNVDSYIAAYDEANPDAPMEYDYTPLKESIPWMEILFYLAMLGCTGFLLFSMMRGGGAGGGIMNVGKARVKDRCAATGPAGSCGHPWWAGRRGRAHSARRAAASAQRPKSCFPFCSVTSATSSVVMLLISAMRAAMYGRLRESLRLPRFGTGDR